MLGRTPVEGVFNIRDLGGFATPSGAVTRAGLIFRSDGLHRTDDDGRRTLTDNGLRTVIDLRTQAELDREGRFEHPRVAFHHIPVLESLPTFDDDGHPVAEMLQRSYADWLSANAEPLAAALHVVAGSIERQHPVAYHCTAGKDRTGLLTALILGSVGVADDDIAADYGRSAEAMPRLFQWYEAQGFERPKAMDDANKRAAFMGADPATMLATLAGITERFGGVRAYVDHIGAEASIGTIATALVD